MKSITIKSLSIIGLLGVFCLANLRAQTPAPPQNNSFSNTGVNQGDGEKDAITPFSQSNDPADLKVTLQIRRAVIAQKNLSQDAQNIKIITTSDHVVYLRGMVDSQSERETVVSLARKISPYQTLRNELKLPFETQPATK